MTDHIDRALRPLVEKLRARYPEVQVIEARKTVWDDGFVQQIVRYRAPLADLMHAGLVTDEMLKERKAQSACGETSLGDAFHLSECSTPESGEGCWELDLCTESVPRDRELKRTDDARRVLERIFQGCKPASNGSA